MNTETPTTSPTINLTELEQIVRGFKMVSQVLRGGSFPGSLSVELLSAIQFIGQLELNQEALLNQLKAQQSDQQPKELNLVDKSKKAKKK